MKRCKVLFISLFMILLGACTKAPVTWEGHYDLGMKYLMEGNYEEAILSFTAAIEIDAKRIEAYIGRGDSYFAYEELEDHYMFAITDFETALELDKLYVEVYLKLADVYFALDDEEAAVEILKKGCQLTNDERIRERLAEEGYNYYADISARLIVNEIEYAEREMAAMEMYPDICFQMFGIRFTTPINSEISESESEHISEAQIDFADESGITYEMLNILEEWDDDTMMDAYNWEYLNRDLMVSGYLSYDENYQEISPDENEMVFIPNGPYTFELIDWAFAE